MRLEVKGKYDYNSGHEDDLSFNAGQIIIVTEEVDEEWYQGEYTDTEGHQRRGMFPRNFVVPSKPRISTVASGAPSSLRQGPAQPSAQSSSTVRINSKPPGQIPSVPIMSPSNPGSSAKILASPTSEAQTTPPQFNVRTQPSEETGTVKPSSFRDRIAAFNKSSDAPLAPRTMPKPTSFVRKPFIPAPPSKSSYFVPPKATVSAKSLNSDQTPTNRGPADPPRSMLQESQSELDFGKDNLKEKIMAIQKELHHTNQMPNRGPVRLEVAHETDDVENAIQTFEGETPNDEGTQNVVEGGHDASEKRMEDSNEGEIGAVNTTGERIEDEEEIDPEVARRIAIRERMAKMSGGMGMHMGFGLPAVYPRGKPAIKAPSQPPNNPASERTNPTPVMPGLPPLKPKELERGLPMPMVEELERVGGPQHDGAILSGDEAAKDDDYGPESSDESRSKEDFDPLSQNTKPPLITKLETDSQSETDNAISSVAAYKPTLEVDSPVQDSDGESIASSNPENQEESAEPRVSITAQGQTQQAARPPPIPTPFSSAEGVLKSRPPPPPPPAPPIPTVDPPRSTIVLDLSPAAPPSLTQATEGESDVDMSDSDHPPDALPPVHSPTSLKPPSSRPPPPPPPQMMPPRALSIPAKAPPIPTVPRNFDTATPSHDQLYPRLSEVMSSPIEPSLPTPKLSDELQSPYSPPSPTLRSSLPDRSSQEMPRNRGSLESARREVSYMAMKEENLQDGRQWWLESGALPEAFKNRSDLVYEIEDSTSTRRGNYVLVTRQVYILFSDYSQTQVTAQYDRFEPSRVNLSQRHLPPPPQPSKSDLEARHEQIGHQVVALAQMRIGASVGDGSALALVHDVFAKLENCLPSAGVRSHGALVFSNFGNSSTRQFDEIRPGDVVAFRHAIFQVHGGLRGKSTLEVGKPDHVAIVQEWNGTKRKLKVLEQRPDTKRVSVNGYRLGDLKSGEVHVFRPMPRSWVDW